MVTVYRFMGNIGCRRPSHTRYGRYHGTPFESDCQRLDCSSTKMPANKHQRTVSISDIITHHHAACFRSIPAISNVIIGECMCTRFVVCISRAQRTLHSVVLYPVGCTISKPKKQYPRTVAAHKISKPIQQYPRTVTNQYPNRYSILLGLYPT